ncbi:MAG TPA: hypothetical protein VF937_09330, partial [Chloroflexota bacterium]
MSELTRIELSPALATLDPGGPPTTLRVTVYNGSPIVDQFTLSVDGLETDWFSLTPGSASLFPGEQAEFQIEVHAPPTATAGQRAFRVVATSRDNPSESSSASGAVDVAAGNLAPGVLAPLELTIAPQRRLARGRSSAHYTLELNNQRNEDLFVQLVATDPNAQLDLSFGPQRLLVPAGSSATASLDARARHGFLTGQPRTFEFAVQAIPADDPLQPPLSRVSGELVQRAQVPALAALAWAPSAVRRRVPLALAGLAALALLIWFLAGPGSRSGGVPERPAPPTAVAAASPSAGVPPVAAP